MLWRVLNITTSAILYGAFCMSIFWKILLLLTGLIPGPLQRQSKEQTAMGFYEKKAGINQGGDSQRKCVEGVTEKFNNLLWTLYMDHCVW